MDTVQLLRQVSIFAELPQETIGDLARRVWQKTAEAGSVIVSHEEAGDALFVIASGKVKVVLYGETGREIILSMLRAGDFFGEMTLIEMQNRSATVVAESPTMLYELTAQKLYTCYKADIHAYVMVMQNINRELCRRLRRADGRIAELIRASE